MTANELAYKLEKVSNDMEHSYVVNDWKLLFESALVLRKQAKEIEQLKERLEETRQLYLKQLAITHSDTQSHPIEPVAMRYDFDGYGYMYIDSGSGSDWKTRENGELLYTKPFFSQKPIVMMVKMDGFDKPEFTTTCSSAALKHPNYTALYDHPPIAFAELEAGESIPLYEHSEDRDSAIYATGYWNGIQKAKEKNETLDTRSYLIGRYDGLRELSDATIRELSVAFMLVLRRTSEDELFESVYEYSKLLLKKVRGQ